MSIPTGQSAPGAQLGLRARAAAPDPETTIIVKFAGRTRSIIGTQSLINAGLPNKIFALRNGTIGWTLAGQSLETGRQQTAPDAEGEGVEEARATARRVAYRAGVKRLSWTDLDHLKADKARTLYLYDVRQPDAFARGHLPGFRNAQGGQLVQETDHFAPVRGARIVLSDDLGPRADMTASWLAQMGWETYVLDGGYDGALEVGPPEVLPKPDPSHRYRRPYEGTDVDTAAMQAYLDWEYGLVEQLQRDATHGFFVI
jgi:rhodanese-related sulfurtransferase